MTRRKGLVYLGWYSWSHLGTLGHPLLEINRDDTDPCQAERLRLFLDRVAAERVWDIFTTPEHLANRAAFAISKCEAGVHPGPARSDIGMWAEIRYSDSFTRS
jgi:hypothetical protein